MTNQLSTDEFNERVAILRRFKEALIEQRDRFRDYLTLLESGGTNGSPEENLEFHVEMERSIVREIATFERTIEPLEQLYRAHDPEGAREIPTLREALTRTRDEVIRRTTHNQHLLRAQLESLRAEIDELKIVRRSVQVPGRTVRTAASRASQPSEAARQLVDVSA